MAQWRPLHRRITKSDKLLALARLPYARALYMELLPYTDREGRLNANPAGLSGTVFEGYGYSPAEIEGWLRELARVGLVVLYRTPRHELLVQYLKFQEMCKPDKREPESELPGPGESGSTVLEGFGEGSGKEPGSLREESAKVPGTPQGDFAEIPRPDVHVHVHSDVHVHEDLLSDSEPAAGASVPVEAAPRRQVTKPKKPPKGSVKVEDLDPDLREIVSLWNEHCGPLPAWETVDPERWRSLRRAQETHGADLLPRLLDATREVVRDAYWVSKQFGLGNLLAKSHLVERSDAWRNRRSAPARASPGVGEHRELTAEELLAPSNLEGNWRP